MADMQGFYYFAYGSNMSSRRLRRRIPSARPIEIARLDGHRLAWHKKGGDGSGKCDIPEAEGDEVVYGVLYTFDPVHKPILDRFEGLGSGYGEKQVDLWLPDRGDVVSAMTYYALVIDPTYVPYDWYRDHVLIGAREHRLPEHYVRLIENVPTFEDSDKVRERTERGVHEDDFAP